MSCQLEFVRGLFKMHHLWDQTARKGYISRLQRIRTNDEAFREKIYDDHHKIDSPLLLLDNFDIILEIIVSDQLHLID